MKRGTGTVTIRDIARECGVSVSTVSKALNNYGEIGTETADMIRNKAAELHYVPNTAARQLKTNISHNIGVLFEDETGSGLSHEYFAVILNGAKDEAEKSGYDITFIGKNLGGVPMSYLEHSRYRSCDGILIANVNFENRAVVELVKSEIPVVTIDYAFDSVSCVVSDNMQGGYELTSYLIRKGHRKIAFICGDVTSVTNKRIVGVNRALKEYGIVMPEKYMVRAKYHDPESSKQATRYLMNLPDPPTAILYPDDYSYLGGMTEIQRMGLSIPSDISTAAYDGIAMSQVLTPRITTYRQDAQKIGRRSIRKLIETIEHPKTCVPEEIQVTGELLEGKSVAEI